MKYRPEIRFPSSSAKSSVFFVGGCEQRGDHRSGPHGIEHRGEAAREKESAKDMECVADAGSLEPSSNDDKIRRNGGACVRCVSNIDNKCDSPCVIIKTVSPIQDKFDTVGF